jgi:hypothetical protein
MYVAIPAARPFRRVPLNGTDDSAPFDWAAYAGKGAILAGVLMLLAALNRGRK